MQPYYHQNYGRPTPGYPPSMPNYWGGHPQDMTYYQPPMQPYPFQMEGDSVYQKQGEGYPGVNPYPPYPNQPMTIGTYPGAMMNPYPSQPQAPQSFNPFENPLQPKVKQPPQQPFANPYPTQQFMQKAQPSGIQSVLNQFKTQDGSMDVTKMMNTAGQMVNTVSQMTSVFKGVGGLFKLKV
jgi:YppG-like protein